MNMYMQNPNVSNFVASTQSSSFPNPIQSYPLFFGQIQIIACTSTYGNPTMWGTPVPTYSSVSSNMACWKILLQLI